MKDAIKNAVNFLFDGLSFSKENERNKERITTAAIEKYENDIAGPESPTESAGKIILNCGSIDNICSYLDIQPAKNENLSYEPADRKTFTKSFKQLRRMIYVISLLTVFLLGLADNILFHFSFIVLITDLILGSLVILGIIFCGKRLNRIADETLFWEKSYESGSRKTTENYYDLYTKKLNNCILGAISLFALLFISIVFSVLTSKYTFGNVVILMGQSLTIIQLMIYFLLKNFLCRRMIARFLCGSRITGYGKEVKRLCLCSAVYYLFFFILLFFIRNQSDYIMNYTIAVSLLYFILILFYNVIRRRKFTYRNITLNIKKIICYSLATVLFLTYSLMKMDLYLTQPYINTVSAIEHNISNISYNEDSGVYTITTNADNFKILQLTDIHLGGSILSVSEDIKALKACYRLISETRPDFVAIKGDLVFPMGIMSFSLNNNAPVMQFANFMRNVGIPWAFTYGNHDTEALATLNRAEFDELMKSISFKTSKNLLYPYIQPDIYGRSNQLIEIHSSDGALMQALFFIDSNDYIPSSNTINEYDYIHDDQVDWYKRTVENLSQREGYVVPSMIFTHIPLREYKTANDLYENGSNEVTYFYGILGERMFNKICCSKYDSKLFETAVELGSTKAIFCGHDHYNNQSLEYQGIRLTYGYSIDYLAMPGIEKDTEQRGATLITIKKDGAFEITPYRLVDLK